MRLRLPAAILAAGALLVSGCGGSTGQASAPATLPTVPTPAPTATAGQYSKVLVIAEENKSYDEVLTRGRAPYLGRLATRYATATAMDAGYPVACPSLAAYLLMTSGDRAGVCDNADPAAHQLPNRNIFQQVAESGREWRNYAESMPRNCTRTNAGNYLVRHAPAPYYTSEKARCERWDVPLGTLDSGALHDDLAAGALPAYGFVTPDACNDMHGGNGCGGDLVATGDAWLARWMPRILASPDYRAGHLVVIVTWDEGSTTDNHIATLVVAPTANHVVVRQPLTQCPMLRLAEETLGLPPLGCAASAADPRAAFHLT